MKQSKTRTRQRRLLMPGALLVGLLVVVVVVFILEKTNTTHFFHKQKATSGTIISTNGASQQTKAKADASTKAATSGASNTPTTDTNAKISTPAPTSTTVLTTPYGTFVSNHHPSLGGDSSPSQEQSTCTTTPGASCYLKFTKNGVIKTLQTQAADQSGAVYWTWDVKQSGFDEGSWQVTAVATLNGQTKSAQDSMTMEVQP